MPSENALLPHTNEATECLECRMGVGAHHHAQPFEHTPNTENRTGVEMEKADRGRMTFMFWKVRGTSFDSNTVVSFDLVVSSCSLDVKIKEKESYVVVPVTILGNPCRGSQSGQDEENDDKVSPSTILRTISSSRPLWSVGSLRSTTRQKRQCHKFCIFNEQKQKLCTPFTCCYYFCTFLSRSRQICDVKRPFLKFYREHEHTGVNWNFLS